MNKFFIKIFLASIALGFNLTSFGMEAETSGNQNKALILFGEVISNGKIFFHSLPKDRDNLRITCKKFSDLIPAPGKKMKMSDTNRGLFKEIILENNELVEKYLVDMHLGKLTQKYMFIESYQQLRQQQKNVREGRALQKICLFNPFCCANQEIKKLLIAQGYPFQ